MNTEARRQKLIKSILDECDKMTPAQLNDFDNELDKLEQAINAKEAGDKDAVIRFIDAKQAGTVTLGGES